MRVVLEEMKTIKTAEKENLRCSATFESCYERISRSNTNSLLSNYLHKLSMISRETWKNSQQNFSNTMDISLIRGLDAILTGR